MYLLGHGIETNILKSREICFRMWRSHCLVSPPEFEKVYNHNAKFFACSRAPPDVGVDSISPCVICGYECTNPKENLPKCKKLVHYRCGEECGEANKGCRTCKRPVHPKCVKILNINMSNFCCKFVKRHLGKNAQEIKSVPIKRKRVVNKCDKCLVCSQELVGVRVECDLACGYGAHEVCTKVLEIMKGTKFDETNKFRCSEVTHQIPGSEINKIARGNFDERNLNKKRRNWAVNFKNYSVKRKRYLNGTIQCPDCNMDIDIDDENHKLQDCAKGNVPVGTTDEFIWPRLQRLKDSLNEELGFRKGVG